MKEKARLIHDDMKALAELNDAVRDDVKKCRNMAGVYHDSSINKINAANELNNNKVNNNFS